ncbi:uncharacterized protein V2V93DRAFT_367457 [Kockiozyma suomiensis]|uniref:uncharacterized protein n=1 Tax=Kockiozyma suomiensis TaxID=1337062 RepID=UPI0033438F13
MVLRSIVSRGTVCPACRLKLTQFRFSSSASNPRPSVQVITNEELDSVLSESTWKVQSLLKSSSGKANPDINSSSLRQLLRRSGLQVPTSEEEEQKLLRDLQRQLIFVDHVQDVDTTGIEPLNRIGEDGEQLRWEDLQEENAQCDILDTRQFGEKLDRGYYFIRDKSGASE